MLAINPDSLLATSELNAIHTLGVPSAKRSPAAQSLARRGTPLRVAIKWTVAGLALILCLVVAAATVPLFMGNRSLVILSGSMEPAVPKGALVVAQPLPAQDLRIGDVIVFSPNASAVVPVVHRIADIEDRNGTRYYTTRGDANPGADASQVSLPPTAWRVGYSVPLAGYLVSYAASPTGTLLLIFIPLLSLAGRSGLDWLRKRAAKAEITMSVCNGASLLAAAGLLDGRPATTNKAFWSRATTPWPNVKWVKRARWVDDGNIVTSSGVSAGIDMTLHVVERLFGKQAAEGLANGTEYEWHRDHSWDPYAELHGLVQGQK